MSIALNISRRVCVWGPVITPMAHHNAPNQSSVPLSQVILKSPKTQISRVSSGRDSNLHNEADSPLSSHIANIYFVDTFQ